MSPDSMPPPENDQEPSARRGGWAIGRFAPIVAIVAGLVAIYAFGVDRYISFSMLAEHHSALVAKVEAHPLVFALGFFLIYVVAVACSFPGAFVLTIVAGFVFGVLGGGVLVAVAATLGATILFLAARTAVGASIADRVGPFASRFAAGFREDAFNYLLILRLIPVFPFFIVNIAPALFNVRTSTYVAATFLGILPGTFVFAWVGSGLESVLEKATAMGRAPKPGDFLTPGLMSAFVALAMIAAVPVIYRHVRARRRDAIDKGTTSDE